jgi:hypothetical protein
VVASGLPYITEINSVWNYKPISFPMYFTVATFS